MRSRQNAVSSSIVSSPPATGTTTACTRSPQVSSGTPMTAQPDVPGLALDRLGNWKGALAAQSHALAAS
jgi:hypothetical protein